MTEPDSESQRRRPDESEPDIYELNLDDSEKPSTAPSKPGRSPSSASPPKTATPATKTDEGGDYELAEPEEKPRTTAPKPAVRPDPRLDTSAVPSTPAPPDAPAGGSPSGASAKPTPKQYQSEPEPAYLDPAVAASKREQARIRAAEQLAIEEAKRKKTKLIVLAVCAAIVLIALIWWMFFG